MGEASLPKAALHGSCPQCGGRTVFAGPAQVADYCRACGLDLAALEPSGRLNGLLTLAIAAVLITLALTVDEALRPPLWVHALVWAPLTIGSVIGALRLVKMAGLQRAFERETRA
jgi:uncharacterized protein (DUF983 family)